MRQSRFARSFYMHVGSFVALLVYATCLVRAGHSPEGLRYAVLVALAVETGYVALAARRGELKYADYCVWTVFALGTLLVYAGVSPAVRVFQDYSPALFFGTFGFMALVPLVLGRETFTYYYARRQTPRWQQSLPTFHSINRLLAAFWTFIFFAAAVLAASAPHDWRFTALYPNLLVFAVGVPAPLWLVPLFLRFFPPALPQRVEPLIMGMPFVFDAEAARDVEARIQFCVSGADAGDYYLQIANGKCESAEGRTRMPDLTVYTPDTVWVEMVHGQLDRARALEQNLYRVEGELTILAKMAEWFPPRRTESPVGRARGAAIPLMLAVALLAAGAGCARLRPAPAHLATPQRLDFEATAYSVTGITTAGTETRRGIVAADPAVLPLGSRIRVDGAGAYSGVYTVADTGPAVNGHEIDIFIPDDGAAKRFGRRRVGVQILERGTGR